MSVLTNPNEVRDLYQELAERSVCLACFCAEDQDAVEAVLIAAKSIGAELGISRPPVSIAFTGSYPLLPQAKRYTISQDTALGAALALDDIERLAGEDGPYANVRVLPHLDHAQPTGDEAIIYGMMHRFATIMFDASHHPFEENVRLTAAYVERARGRIIEGAVDEIYEAGSGAEKNEPTTPERAKEFLSRTGVFLIVPNVGTEHRSTIRCCGYMADRARQISAAVGKRLVLHGTSGLRDQSDLRRLADDGFVKVNIWTRVAISGGQAVARQVIRQIGNILEEGEIRHLVQEGLLPERWLRPEVIQNECSGRLGPKLSAVTALPRKSAWVNEAVRVCKEYFYAFGYERLADRS